MLDGLNDAHGIEKLLLKTQVSWTSSCIMKWIYIWHYNYEVIDAGFPDHYYSYTMLIKQSINQYIVTNILGYIMIDTSNF